MEEEVVGDIGEHYGEVGKDEGTGYAISGT